MRRHTAQVLALLAATTLVGSCSGAAEQVTVPALDGRTVQDARWIAIDADLRVADVDSSIDEGSCIVESQTPVAGTDVDTGSTVTVSFFCPEAAPEVVAPDEAADEGAADALEAEPDAELAGAAQVEAAFSASYGWPDDPHWAAIESFSDRDYPRITVATSLVDEIADAEQAMGICNAVTSVLSEDWTGTYVTAGEGGPFLAECDRP
ncbi:PASTA domain-containing protein [Cellulosimicrobium sp. Marseille-Q4280]|uniref:PASTA domain-containing protein n=1 Tax=Cellulosimicrobium sp. Marseille-Q4280 TaxID=2937992 RepID=UPI00203B5A9B|nr:PASTA domain-containing protein [Cellulosimicrobium sp. Marseille-Q4280]